MKTIVIDIHAHFTPKYLVERYDSHAAQFPGVKLLRGDKGVRIAFPGIEPTRPIMPKLSDLDDRRAWMDKNGTSFCYFCQREWYCTLGQYTFRI